MVLSSATFAEFNLDDRGENVRESVDDIITIISPTEVPFTYNIGRGSGSRDFHEWAADELEAASSANARQDGADFGTHTNNVDPAFRFGTYMQISGKEFKVSRRSRIANTIGREDEVGYQLSKQGRALKRDVESVLLSNQASVAPASGTAPTTAGLPSWIITNANAGATATAPTLSSTTFGFINAARGDGTARALSVATLLNVVRDTYNEGGSVNMIMMGTTVKQRLSLFLIDSGQSTLRNATPYQDHGKNPMGGVHVAQGVSVFDSDFGSHDLVPNRFQRARDVHVIDTSLWELVFYDGYRYVELGKGGDNDRFLLTVDYGLKSKQEKGSGAVFDIDTAAAVVA